MLWGGGLTGLVRTGRTWRETQEPWAQHIHLPDVEHWGRHLENVWSGRKVSEQSQEVHRPQENTAGLGRPWVAREAAASALEDDKGQEWWDGTCAHPGVQRGSPMTKLPRPENSHKNGYHRRQRQLASQTKSWQECGETGRLCTTGGNGNGAAAAENSISI